MLRHGALVSFLTLNLLFDKPSIMKRYNRPMNPKYVDTAQTRADRGQELDYLEVQGDLTLKAL